MGSGARRAEPLYLRRQHFSKFHGQNYDDADRRVHDAHVRQHAFQFQKRRPQTHIGWRLYVRSVNVCPAVLISNAGIAAPETLASFGLPQTISALCDLVVNPLDLERHAAVLRVLQVAFEEEVPFGLQFVAFTLTSDQCLLHCLQPHPHYEAFATRFARFQREFSLSYVRMTVPPATHLEAFGGW